MDLDLLILQFPPEIKLNHQSYTWRDRFYPLLVNFGQNLAFNPMQLPI